MTLGASARHGSQIVFIYSIFSEGSCRLLNKTILNDHALCCKYLLYDNTSVIVYVTINLVKGILRLGIQFARSVPNNHNVIIKALTLSGD
jgi:hypothetical protein